MDGAGARLLKIETEDGMDMCRECHKRKAADTDGLCLGCNLVAQLTAAFPALESYEIPEDDPGPCAGMRVVDMSRVDLWPNL
jgi:hypothetical protein